jgi:hypothetical protein
MTPPADMAPPILADPPEPALNTIMPPEALDPPAARAVGTCGDDDELPEDPPALNVSGGEELLVLECPPDVPPFPPPARLSD